MGPKIDNTIVRVDRNGERLPPLLDDSPFRKTFLENHT